MKIITTVALAVLLAVACGRHLFAGNGTDTYESKTYGFRIRRPNSTWKFNENLNAEKKLFTVTITSPDSKASVYVMATAPAVEMKPADHRDTKLAELLRETRYTNVKKEQGKIAKQKAPGLSLDTKLVDGSEVTICQFYVTNGGFFYILQCTAIKSKFKGLSQMFAKILESFAFVTVSEKDKPKGSELVGRCGSEVQWYNAWEPAAKRAQAEKKLIIATAQFYSGFTLQALDYARIGPFMEPDIIELARERFVVMKLTKEADAPFKSGHVYGMGPSSFGVAVLFVTPDGKVVGDAFNFEQFYLYDYMLSVLAANPGFTGTPVKRTGRELDRAEAFLCRGELEQAQEILKKTSTARGLRLKASLYRRLRQGEKALKAIEEARSKKKSGMEADLAADEALILLRMGDYRKAMLRLSEVVKKHPKSERVPEAMYWLGACVRTLTKKDNEQGWWAKLVKSHPESRWAWKAAVDLVIAGTKGTRLRPLDWPDEAVLDTVRDKEWEAREVSEVKKAEQEALSFLLQAQKGDGSWITPSELGRLSEASIPLHEGKVALCGLALLSHGKEAKASRAVAGAQKYLVGSYNKRKGGEHEEFYMDYNVWSHSCMLRFFSKSLQTGAGSKRELASVMAELVRDLQRRQRPGGGWSYYISASLGKGYKADDKSISFVTAAVILGLLDAKGSGVAVPEEMLRRALDCLEKMRNQNGSFTYFLDHRNPGARDSNLPGSAGRVPLCELALYRGGRTDLSRVRQGLDIFLRYRHELSGQRGKALMHTGRHGQGSHYLMFDYAISAEAVGELPENRRAAYRDTLLELVLGARTVEGSYLGSPLLGHCYGTAMALLAFQCLGR